MIAAAQGLAGTDWLWLAIAGIVGVLLGWFAARR